MFLKLSIQHLVYYCIKCKLSVPKIFLKIMHFLQNKQIVVITIICLINTACIHKRARTFRLECQGILSLSVARNKNNYVVNQRLETPVESCSGRKTAAISRNGLQRLSRRPSHSPHTPPSVGFLFAALIMNCNTVTLHCMKV